MRLALSWALFWAGHAVSRLDRLDSEWLVRLWYPVYNWCMGWSSDIQGDRVGGPWLSPGREPMRTSEGKSEGTK